MNLLIPGVTAGRRSKPGGGAHRRGAGRSSPISKSFLTHQPRHHKHGKPSAHHRPAALAPLGGSAVRQGGSAGRRRSQWAGPAGWASRHRPKTFRRPSCPPSPPPAALGCRGAGACATASRPARFPRSDPDTSRQCGRTASAPGADRVSVGRKQREKCSFVAVLPKKVRKSYRDILNIAAILRMWQDLKLELKAPAGSPIQRFTEAPQAFRACPNGSASTAGVRHHRQTLQQR